MTYLIDEASDVGKGANTVISFLHHFFQHHGLGEVDVGLHADNCVRQNKSSTGKELHVHLQVRNTTHCVVRLVSECTLVNVYLITVSCLACADWTTSHCADVLHACGPHKFAPDWCFGLFKQRYRRTFVSSLDDAVDVVNTSTDVNVAQLVGTQSGEPVVPVYNWASYLGVHFRSIPHLKQYHHFIFSATHPGVVTLKSTATAVKKHSRCWTVAVGLQSPASCHHSSSPVVSPSNGSGICTDK